jgi:hypothetical protein
MAHRRISWLFVIFIYLTPEKENGKSARLMGDAYREGEKQASKQKKEGKKP